MQRDLRSLLFAALLAAVLWCSWLVLRPFLPGIVWAAVLVVTFKPFHAGLTRAFRDRAWAASGVVTLLVALFVVVPVVVAAIQVVQGSIRAYDDLQTSYYENGPVLGVEDKWPWVNDAVERAKELIGLANVDVKAAAVNGLKRAGSFVAAKAPAFVGGVLGLVFSFFVMLIMMVVFFADGERVARAVTRALPLPATDAERIMHDLGVMTRSVFISVGLTALVQATLGGIAMLALGVSNAFTLGAAMFFSALLPGGTAIVWIPVTIWLFATGHPWKAAIFLVWCAGVVGTIDNVLRPYFAKDGVKLPTMMLVLGLLGGLIAFGLVGLFAGPIILYLMREILQLLRRDVYGDAPEAPEAR